MSKISLSQVADLTQTTTAQTTINSNTSTIQTAFDNTLSRDGTSPNQMGAALDMNSNQIINLPAPSTVNSPARLVDITNPVAVPNSILLGNNVFTGTNTFSAIQGSVWGNTRSAKTANYTVQNTDKGLTLALGGSVFYTLTFNAANTYDANFLVAVINEDTGRGKTLAINGLSNFILWPGQTVFVYAQNNTWHYTPISRWLMGGLTFNVDPVNGNDANDGLATGTGAFRTIQAAVNIISSSVDTSGGRAGILLADGTYTTGASATIDVGQFGCLIAGQVGHAASVIINVANGATGFNARDFAEFSLDNMTITGGTTSFGITSSQFGIVDVNGGVVFGAFGAGGIHINCTDLGSININGNYSITGGAAYHMFCTAEGKITSGPLTASISSSLTFTGAFISVTRHGLADMASWSFSGAASITAQKYNVQQWGCILTTVDPNTIFPGSTSGVNNGGTLDFNSAVASWTPVDGSGASLALTVTDANFQQISNQCSVSAVITYPSTANGSNAQINGLPVLGRNGSNRFSCFAVLGIANLFALVALNGTSMIFINGAGTPVTNASLSTATIRLAFTYFTN